MRYIQVPAGWWQDSKGRMQPPGSFLDPALRISSARTPEGAEHSSSRRRRRFLGAMRHRVD